MEDLKLSFQKHPNIDPDTGTSIIVGGERFKELVKMYGQPKMDHPFTHKQIAIGSWNYFKLKAETGLTDTQLFNQTNQTIMYNMLPLELITEITKDYNLNTARLINKQTLRANHLRFCQEMKLTKNDIHAYAETCPTHTFAIGSKNGAFFIYSSSHCKLIYSVYTTKHEIVIYKHDAFNMIEEFKNNDTDLLSTYHIYDRMDCAESIHHFAKMKCIDKLLEINSWPPHIKLKYFVVNLFILPIDNVELKSYVFSLIKKTRLFVPDDSDPIFDEMFEALFTYLNT